MQSMPRKYPPRNYTNTNSLHHLYEVGCIHSFFLVKPNSTRPIQILQQKSKLIITGKVVMSFECPIVQFW